MQKQPRHYKRHCHQKQPARHIQNAHQSFFPVVGHGIFPAVFNGCHQKRLFEYLNIYKLGRKQKVIYCQQNPEDNPVFLSSEKAHKQGRKARQKQPYKNRNQRIDRRKSEAGNMVDCLHI